MTHFIGEFIFQLLERRNQEPLETASLSGPVTETWNAVRKFIGGEFILSLFTNIVCFLSFQELWLNLTSKMRGKQFSNVEIGEMTCGSTGLHTW